ncbi:DUF6113 family protein [Streptomyces sp. NPDC051219]|uniref:DUF6113 family protein n=1 Tax=Streptomyces sp. NPDC051219 TaxID=3155283 RepID=UPI00342503C1
MTPPASSASAFNPARIALYLLLVMIGVAVGVAGALVQGAWFPGGLLLVLLATTAFFYAGRRAAGGPAGVLAGAAGWMLSFLLLSATRPEGDFIFAAGLGTYAFLLGGIVAAVMCATLQRLSEPPVPDARLGK